MRLEVQSNHLSDARRLAEQAERKCLVSASLDLPVETEIVVKPLP
jgi:organic hydroperoxide reductase OsmC/OhrA